MSKPAGKGQTFVSPGYML